jgi:4-aminobutyrate aminotransferase-like enzyme
VNKVAKRTIYTPSPATAALVEREDATCAHTYHPLPVVLSRGRGCRVWDVDGKGARWQTRRNLQKKKGKKNSRGSI